MAAAANPFDQFDAAPVAAGPPAANPFDQFDPTASAPGIGATVAHAAEDVLGVPEAIGTGILNTPYDFLSGARTVGNIINQHLGLAPVTDSWIDKLRFAPTAPTEQVAQDVNNSTAGRAIDAAAAPAVQAVERTLAQHPALEQTAEAGGGLLKMAGAAGPLMGAAGAGLDTALGLRQAVAAALSRPLKDTPEDMDAALQAVGYRSLPSQTPGAGVLSKVGGRIVGENPLAQHQTLTNQAVTDTLGLHEAGVPAGTSLSRPALVAAAKAGPAKVYEAAESSLTPTLTQDPELQSGIASIGDTVSQLPRSPDVEGLKQTMLDQPTMTRRQLFANVQQARQRGAIYTASEDPDKAALGRAYLDLANQYEGFIGRQLEANPQSPVSLQDFQNARTAFAKNYAVQAGLRGPDATAIDAGRIARQAAQNPGELTGGLRLIAAQHARYPLSTNYGPTTLAEGGIGRSGDLPGMLGRQIGGGALAAGLARMFHLPEEVGFGAGMIGTSLAMNRLRNILAGSPEAAGEMAAGAAANPRLASFFLSDRDAAPPAGFGRSPPPIRGLLPSPAMVNAGGGATTPTTLTQDLGLTPDVQAAGSLHPGAPRAPALGPTPPEDAQAPSAMETAPGSPEFELERSQGQTATPAGRQAPAFGRVPLGGPTLAPEVAAEIDRLFPQGEPSYADLLTAMAPEGGGEPLIARGANGPDAVNARRRIGGPEGVSRGQNNASGESAASLEAINRGTLPIDEVDPSGLGRPVMRDVTQIDRTPAPGNIFVNRSTGEIVHRGQMNQRLAEGLRNRYLAMRAMELALEPHIPF